MHIRLISVVLSVMASLMLGPLQAAQAQGASVLSVVAMTTNARSNPLGIGADDISFAWALGVPARGAQQQAYQLRVGTQPQRGR